MSEQVREIRPPRPLYAAPPLSAEAEGHLRRALEADRLAGEAMREDGDHTGYERHRAEAREHWSRYRDALERALAARA
jgi:hypothetical protein